MTHTALRLSSITLALLCAQPVWSQTPPSPAAPAAPNGTATPPAGSPEAPTNVPTTEPLPVPSENAPESPTESPKPEPATEATAVQSFVDEPLKVESHEPAYRAEDVQTFAEATMVSSNHLRFALNAFGDSSFRFTTPNKQTTFAIGTLALLVNAKLGTNLVGTAEMAFDANQENQQATKLERLSLRWQNQRFFVVGGRMHTDLGYWNTAYHHGPWLQLPAGRPRAVRGEGSGGILPIHWVGIEAGAILPVAPGTVTVSGGIANGRGRDEKDIRLSRDSNDFKSLKLKIEVQGFGWPELRFGGGGIYDRIAPETMAVRPAFPDERIGEAIANVFVAYRGARFTFISEAFALWHTAGEDTFTTTDAYAVAGYRFGIVTPYLQLERMDSMGGVDPFFTPEPGKPTLSTPVDQTEVTGGIRFDISVWSAIKTEYALLRRDHGDDKFAHAVTVNWSFGI